MPFLLPFLALVGVVYVVASRKKDTQAPPALPPFLSASATPAARLDACVGPWTVVGRKIVRHRQGLSIRGRRSARDDDGRAGSAHAHRERHRGARHLEHHSGVAGERPVTPARLPRADAERSQCARRGHDRVTERLRRRSHLPRPHDTDRVGVPSARAGRLSRARGRQAAVVVAEGTEVVTVITVIALGHVQDGWRMGRSGDVGWRM